MSEETQKETIAFLSRPETYGLPADEKVAIILTHISHVFLAGTRVFKLKRAVDLPYVDFTDPQSRKRACEQELTLNRRTAPDIYLKVSAITRDAGGALSLDGNGEAIDWVVVMLRFDQDNLLDALAQQPGKLTRSHMADLAESLFAFHEACDVIQNRGGFAATAAVARGNVEMLERFAHERFDASKLRAHAQETERQLERIAALLDKRRADGRVRRAHGDLHLRNIVLLNGKPTPFDCIEFNDDFAIIDILYDLAFLLMDLDHRGLRALANAVLNRTLDLSGDVDGLACLPLFLSMRAAVRGHVDATQGKFDEGAEYLDLALGYLTPTPARLIAVGGLSGSGKSSLAQLIAPAIGRAPGAAVLRSDAIRKRLAGAGLYDTLPESAYSREMSERVYVQLLDDARRALAAGQAVILDAVHAKADERAKAAALAREAGVPFTGLWLDVPLAIRQDRIGGRKRDASDATAAVAEAQDSYDLGPMDWHILDAGRDPDQVTRHAQGIL